MNNTAITPQVLANELIRSLSVTETLSESDVSLFRELLMESLPGHYDGVDASLPDAIIRATASGGIQNGGFTTRKRLFVARLGDETIGFSVATYKIGGAVKFGPTVIVPHLRRTGYGTWLRRTAEDIVSSDPAVHKLYLTVSASNGASLRFNLGLGYSIEGCVRSHYSWGRDEFILAKLPGRSSAASGPYGWDYGDGEVNVSTVTSYSADFDAYASARMEPLYGRIPARFVAAAIAAGRGSDAAVARGAKTVLSAVSRGSHVGFGVLTSKRGGALKMSPLGAETLEAAKALVRRSVATAKEQGCRKVHTTVDTRDSLLICGLVSENFRIEARLIEAYREGVDAFVFGREFP